VKKLTVLATLAFEPSSLGVYDFKKHMI